MPTTKRHTIKVGDLQVGTEVFLGRGPERLTVTGLDPAGDGRVRVHLRRANGTRLFCRAAAASTMPAPTA